MWPIKQKAIKKRQAIESPCESDQMSDLTEKGFRIAIMNMLKGLKENIKEVN